MYMERFMNTDYGGKCVYGLIIVNYRIVNKLHTSCSTQNYNSYNNLHFLLLYLTPTEYHNILHSFLRELYL